MDYSTHHLYSRAAFGLPLLHKSNGKPVVFHFKDLVKKSGKSSYLAVVDKPQIDPSKNRDNDQNEAIVKSRQNIIKLNTAWIEQMASNESWLREKMTFFWHDHFACRSRVAYFAQQLNNTIREHALGNFGDLLMAVSKTPAMLQFLNNQQNKKNSPNENFAREVMELFTLGRGNYTEADVKNAARAFTGWSFNPATADFIFRERIHDDGIKEFRGKRGNFTGEDIIHCLLEDKQTALFISQKVWKYFVSCDKEDLSIIRELADDFFESGYDIGRMLEKIYTSSWFYDARYVGNRVKSPIELLVGIQMHTGGRFEDDFSSLIVQRTLGQVLFNPPSVAGWPSDKEWIDSSSLTYRMVLPAMMLQGSESTIEAKDNGDVNDLTNQVKRNKLSFSVDWEKLTNTFLKDTALETLEALEYHLLVTPVTNSKRKRMQRYIDSGSNDVEFIQRAFIGLMSLPEYQLS
jgi:uncharacterized protein (DUF1800 family)